MVLVLAALAIGLGPACASRDPSVAPALPSSPSFTEPIRPTTTPDGLPVSPSPPSPPPPAFAGRIDTTDAASLGASWHPGCPVDAGDLRRLTVSFWGFDGRAHTGRLVVHREVAEDVVGVFRELFDAGFPIRRMRPAEAYGGDDDRMMAADDTSGFNCRAVTGGTSWSEHSYGRAIDLDPVENPYVSGAAVLPPAGARYLDRAKRLPGMIEADGRVVRAFAAIGWSWGGTWGSPRDYQHFSSTGR